MSASEERLLVSYCGARRFAYNWVLGLVTKNLAIRRSERAAGVAEDRLTPAVSWSYVALDRRWHEVRDQVAPWWREVSMHAFRCGIADATTALKNWSESRSGKRKGPKVGFPRFKKKDRSVASVSFVEINHQLSWLHPDRHQVRLMLPQSTPDPQVRRRRGQLAWLHTIESTGDLYRLVESGGATIQKVTIAKRGGRWQASFLVRHKKAPARRAVRRRGGLVGVDAGVKHLVTTSEPVPGLTDTDGHVPNPKALESQLHRLRRLDRPVARARRGSKNHKKLLARRACLHGRIANTRA
ncbi:MAG: transposase, partial [Actinobacteria bacterium]|nr:transposase [Actinomycetota bacterium]